MKKNAIMTAFMLLSVVIPARKAIILPELNRPIRLAMDKDRFYVTEGAEILIYSLNTYHLTGKFGKKGQGPEEFIGSALVTVLKDRLLINSQGKVSFFTKDGAFQREMKDKIGLNFTFLPVGDHFVALNRGFSEGFRIRTITLFDNQLNKVKEITRFKDFIQIGKKVNLLKQKGKSYRTMAENIIIDDFDGTIQVMDKTGKIIKTFRPDYKPYRLSDELKKRIIEYMRTNPQLRSNYQRFKDLLEFPDYFPPVQDFIAKDQHIYVLTYRRVRDQAEFFVYDLKGRQTFHGFIPFFDRMPLFTQPYDIINNTLYQLVENDNEQWELHINKIY